MNKILRNCFFLSSTIILSCNNSEEAKKKISEPIASSAVQMPVVNKQQSFYLKTFEVKNDAGQPQGWGYDIYIDSVRTIHQTTIQAIQGNRSFKTEKDAATTGNYAISKMKACGSFPTLGIEELDSLGVTK